MRERAETFDPVKEFNTQCQLLSSKYHTHSPLTTRTNGAEFITLSLKSPKTVNWRGQEFSKDFDSVYELVLTLDKGQLSGNVKIMDGSSIINHPMNVHTYRIADELDPGWKKFFEEADATIGEYEKERADALSAAGFTGSLPDNID